MRNTIKIFIFVLFMSMVACVNQGCNNKPNEVKITETSTLYNLDGGIVISKMQIKENGQTLYGMDVKLNGKNEYVKVTKEEYETFELGDTINVVKETFTEDINLNGAPANDWCYKIVTIGGENYLVIKLENNVIINNTTNFK